MQTCHPGRSRCCSLRRRESHDPSAERALTEPVELVEHDPGWQAAFDAERSRLIPLLAQSVVAIEHIGSTSVPGLLAKPSIDLLVGLRDFRDVRRCVALLVCDGYHHDRESNLALIGRQWLFRHRDGRRTHHAHLVCHESPDWNDRIRFRDLLRGDPRLRARYALLKRRLAVEHGAQRTRYSDAKGPFVEEALNRNDS